MSERLGSEPDRGESPALANPLRAVAAGVGLTILAVAASIVGGVALAVPVIVYGYDVTDTTVFLALLAAGQVGFVLVGFGYARYAGLRVPVEVPDGRGLAYGVGGAVLALALAIGLSIALELAGLLPDSVLAEPAYADPAIFIGLAVLTVVLIAPAEEFLFRGVIQTRLRRAFGPVGAVAGSSLLFGSIHLANYTGALLPVVAGGLLIATVGTVLGAAYELTDNLAVPIVVHAIYNVVLFAVGYLAM